MGYLRGCNHSAQVRGWVKATTPLPLLAWWLPFMWHIISNFFFLKIMMVQLDSFQKIFGFHPFSCHCGSLSLQKSLFVNNLWHEVMSTEESRWILGIDQTLVFKNCLLSSTKHLYIFEHLWPYEAQISVFRLGQDSVFRSWTGTRPRPIFQGQDRMTDILHARA